MTLPSSQSDPQEQVERGARWYDRLRPRMIRLCWDAFTPQAQGGNRLPLPWRLRMVARLIVTGRVDL